MRQLCLLLLFGVVAPNLCLSCSDVSMRASLIDFTKWEQGDATVAGGMESSSSVGQVLHSIHSSVYQYIYDGVGPSRTATTLIESLEDCTLFWMNTHSSTDHILMQYCEDAATAEQSAADQGLDSADFELWINAGKVGIALTGSGVARLINDTQTYFEEYCCIFIWGCSSYWLLAVPCG